MIWQTFISSLVSTYRILLMYILISQGKPILYRIQYPKIYIGIIRVTSKVLMCFSCNLKKCLLKIQLNATQARIAISKWNFNLTLKLLIYSKIFLKYAWKRTADIQILIRYM